MRPWLKLVAIAIVVVVAAVALAVRHEVGKVSDSAAAASIAIRAEKQASEDLGHTFDTLADSHDPRMIDTTVIPALDRYLAAIATAAARSRDLTALHPDPETDAYLAVLSRRATAFGDARDKLAVLHGRPEDQARELATVVRSLMLVK
jgi:uncharacterized protein (DUF885 family)